MKEYQNYILEQFKTYTDAYDSSDPKIKLKIDHTYRVAGFCREIAGSLGLPEEEVMIAWTCGMLHDIGRFEQVKRYGTFFDAQSVDHAQFGADLLFQEGLYETFIVPEKMNWLRNYSYESVKVLVEKAIRVHNVFRIPDGLSEKEMLFATILRDADKIDILRVNYDTAPEDIYNVTTQQLKAAAVSEEAKSAFRERRCVKRDKRTSAVDFLVGHICLTFELVYKRSRQLMFEQGYLFKLLDFESDNEETREWFSYMKSVMREMEKEYES